MRYSYSLNTKNINDVAADEIVHLMMQQTRISTRRRSDRWELKVHADEVRIRFLHRYDRDDFLTVFEPAQEEFLTRHSLVFSGRNAFYLDHVKRGVLPVRARQGK